MNKIQETLRACRVHILVVKNSVFVHCVFKFSKQSPGATAIEIQFFHLPNPSQHRPELSLQTQPVPCSLS